MVHQVILPKLGTNIEDGVLVEWKKQAGEAVKKGDVLLLVETSKAVFEVEAESDGYLRKVFFNAGESVKFTEPVAVITGDMNVDVSGYPIKEQANEKRHFEKKREELINGTRRPDAKRPRPVAATPAARRLSAELNLDIEKIAEAFEAGIIDEEVVRSFSGRKRIAIYGAGLGAKQAKELLRTNNEFTIAGLIDDNPLIKGKELLGLKVLGGWDELKKLASSGMIDSVAVSLHSEHRRKVILKIRKELPSIGLAALVDGRAIISEGVSVSGGAFIEAGSVIGPDTFVGEGAIVDVGAVVSHDCHIGAHSHLSPGCSLSGIVKLEENVLVGVGACVNSQVTVGRNVVITPGSAVVSDVPGDVVVSGNPAKIIGKSLRGS